METPVRVNPILFNRLSLALDGIERKLDLEVEFLGYHLEIAKTEFAVNWDELEHLSSGDPLFRGVLGQFEIVPLLFAVEARMNNDGVLEIRNIKILPDSD